MKPTVRHAYAITVDTDASNIDHLDTHHSDVVVATKLRSGRMRLSFIAESDDEPQVVVEFDDDTMRRLVAAWASNGQPYFARACIDCGDDTDSRLDNHVRCTDCAEASRTR